MSTDLQQIRKITITGVGLIGGSLGLALKTKGCAATITGHGRNLGRLKKARELGAVDAVTTDLDEALNDADLVVIGLPVDLIPATTKNIAESVTDSKPVIITDVGSMKGQIVAEIDQFLDDEKYRHLHFVGAHPMAGSEKTGVANAKPELFEGSKCIVTPTGKTDSWALKIVTELWKFVGCEIHSLAPDVHDFLIAGASHLPHLLATVLTNTVGGINTAEGTALDFTAGGFRDTTRIAAGAPDLWMGIFLQNSAALTPMIETVIEELNRFKALLDAQDAEEISRILTQAKVLRESLDNETSEV
jgi:prephenate dehydrogenase